MNLTSSPSSDALEERFGRAVAARLSSGQADLGHEVTERLRASRMQALAHRKVAPARPAAMLAGTSGGAAILGRGQWLNRLAAALPLVVLAAGLVAISAWQDTQRTNEVADIDAALLTDDLPPTAYTDPGFTQFLKREADAPH
ncbi:MAG: DUF3619 family protein [Xenophilus sp.]